MSRMMFQTNKSLKMSNTQTHINVSIENQLLALKVANIRQILEIQNLKSKISSFERSIHLLEEKISKSENEMNKGPNSTTKRPGSDTSSPHRSAKRPRADPDPANATSPTQSLISDALETLQTSRRSSVLPSDQIHKLLTGTCALPVLREEEKSVISEFSGNESLAEMFLSAILDKIKAEKALIERDLLESLCRVYVGLCQAREDTRKAHALAYRLLKEDFLEAPKVIMVMVTAWPRILFHDSCLCRAIHIVSHLKANGNIVGVLGNYLHWDEEPPENIHKAITSTLKSFLDDGTLKFQENIWYGYDLCPATWDYIFSLDLLCAQLGWTWTVTNIIRKDLWLIVNTWLMQPRTEQTPFRDVCVAAVFRLLGRLGQLGLKENLPMSIQNLAKTINQFGFSKGMPWEVQLSVIYATHDLAPSNPEVARKTLESWREKSTQAVPPAVTNCLTQINSLCNNQTKAKNSR